MLVIEEYNGFKKRIVSVSGTFQHLDGDYLEFGATRVIENGFGFQKLFFSARIIHEAYVAASFKRIYCTVAKDNPVSVHGIEKSGFQLWDPPASDLVREKVANAKRQNRSSNVFYYEVPNAKLDDLMQKHAQNLLEHEQVKLVRKDGQKTIAFELNLIAFGPMYRDVLVKLAEGTIRFSDQRA